MTPPAGTFAGVPPSRIPAWRDERQTPPSLHHRRTPTTSVGDGDCLPSVCRPPGKCGPDARTWVRHLCLTVSGVSPATASAEVIPLQRQPLFDRESKR